ncbi:NADH pyrophosphatase [Fundidesulfovibrio magnetotacticus]|uniref:NAD(+) diphosphatase n=1 Tax=Fundidesulfovibrio magnetotacticus TaxID=2730080 RepID=A0A6V8LSY9_9BACT|nr:NAD(+) diphosphatase [Fundidesulfovibrio magnetotacticus]GFK92926.1 NADH pyrophosphatase [Fundidesulfovibrio magnetotacticus]
MFQDIDPHRIAYTPEHAAPRGHDRMVFLKKQRILLADHGGAPALPVAGDLFPEPGDAARSSIYLFSLGDTAFRYAPGAREEGPGLAYAPCRSVRGLAPGHMAFAAATACHLASWYAHNRHCGLCAAPMLPKEDERALRCPACGMVKYPRISPVVMVGVRHGDALLLVRNATGEYKGQGLVAGFVEAGETLEQALAREVLEETGLRVANPRYYKSQPWAFSQSLLMGFFADLAGDPAVDLGSGELSEALWTPRAEIPGDEPRFSLTWDMIQAFRNGEV